MSKRIRFTRILFTRLILTAVSSIAGAASFAQAGDPIALRVKTMKDVGGAWYREVGQMMRGQAPFDQAAVDAVLDQIVAAAKLMPTLFPEEKKTGDGSRALPTVWDHKDDFVARYRKLGVDAASYKGKITSLAALKADYPVINGLKLKEMLLEDWHPPDRERLVESWKTDDLHRSRRGVVHAPPAITCGPDRQARVARAGPLVRPGSAKSGGVPANSARR